MEKELPLTKKALEELSEAIKKDNANKKEIANKIDDMITKIKEAL